MSDKARELLSRCLRRFNKSSYECSQLVEEIELYLEEPEKKQEPLSAEEVNNYLSGFDWMKSDERLVFKCGVRFAEKHHGIGESK